MNLGLWREFWILVGIATASLVFGLLSGHAFIAALIGFGLYIASHLRYLYELHRWLVNRKRGHKIPDAEGIWGDVFTEIRKLVRHAAQREERLTGLIERFQSAAAVLPDAVVILSEQGEIEWANPAARQLLGVDFPHDAGMRLSNLLRDPDFTQYLKMGQFSDPLEIPAPAKTEATMAVQIVPYGTSQKLIIARDITRITRLEQIRRNFVANASHELRTPLTVLAGYLETLRGITGRPSEDLQQHFATMYEQAARMRRLVDDLLMLSRLETAPPRSHEETIDVPALLMGLKEQAEILSGELRHVITLEAEPGLQLLGGRDELHSAFSNLINNAVRHTPAGQTIALRWYADHEGAKFSVVDTGEGIAQEHIPHLTERFYRVDTARSRASGGTGLGLSIVRHVLLRHDAELQIQSELGQGSTFTCIFPLRRLVRAPIASTATLA